MPDPTTAPTITNDQRRHLADAITAEVARILAKKTKTALDVEDSLLLQRVATNAINFAVAPRPDPSDAKAVKAANRRLANLNAQLLSIQSIGESVASDAFWTVVANVLGRMSSLALSTLLTTAIAAV